MGTLHGGVLCDLADAAMGMAFASTLASDESFSTMTLSINFFPCLASAVAAEARVVNRGTNVGYIECDVTDQNGKPDRQGKLDLLHLAGRARQSAVS